MRYYGEAYLKELTSTVDRIHNSVDMPSLSRPIVNVDVMDHRSQLKNCGVGAANSADKHISDILIKLVQLHSDLVTFYGQVDTLAEDIAKSATQIKRIILSSTTSIDTINSMLAGTGDYAGVDITADKIRNAVQDKQKYKIMLQDAWASVVDAGITADDVKEKAAENYIGYIKEKLENEEELASDEYDRLKSMYGYYVKTRPHMMDGEAALKPDTMQNLIDVYEILDPDAKKAMDELFSKIKKKDENITEQLQRIRYITYTADPKYRDIIIYYSTKTGFRFAKGKNQYDDWINTILIDFNAEDQDTLKTGSTEYSQFSTFFHEFGHAVDDYYKPCGRFSESIKDTLFADLRKHIENSIVSEGMISVSDNERDEVLDYILSFRNANVVPPEGEDEDFFLPDNWNDDQVKLFRSIRDYYGYVEYEFLDKFSIRTDNQIYFPQFEYKGDDKIVLSDIIGALTNNQIGATSGSHYYGSRNNWEICNPGDLKYRMEKEFGYWYFGSSPNYRIGTEFMANCFRASVLGSDMESARSVFGESCKAFDQFVEETYSSVPDEYKNKDF